MSRLPYFLCVLSLSVLMASIYYVEYLAQGPVSALTVLKVIVGLTQLFVFICRLVDMGRSPLLCFLLFVPIVNIGVLVWLFVAPSA